MLPGVHVVVGLRLRVPQAPLGPSGPMRRWTGWVPQAPCGDVGPAGPMVHGMACYCKELYSTSGQPARRMPSAIMYLKRSVAWPRLIMCAL